MDTFRRTVARNVSRVAVVTEAKCFGPAEAFVYDDADIPPDLLVAIVANRGLACDGGGVPGDWCKHCPWGEVHYVGEYEVDEEGERDE